MPLVLPLLSLVITLVRSSGIKNCEQKLRVFREMRHNSHWNEIVKLSPKLKILNYFTMYIMFRTLPDASQKSHQVDLCNCQVVDSLGQNCLVCDDGYSIDHHGACTITDPSQCASIDPNCASCDLQTGKCLRCVDLFAFRDGTCVKDDSSKCYILSCKKREASRWCRTWGAGPLTLTASQRSKER